MKQLTHASSCIAIPAVVEARDQLSQSPCDLQDRKHRGEPSKIRPVPVRLVYRPRFLTLVDPHGYSDLVEAKGNFGSDNKSRGNERRRWHGTTRKCNIGDKGVTELCSDTSCSLCRIIENSFDISFFAGKTGWGRFGAGIYTSSTSSKFVPAPTKCIGAIF